MTWNTEEWGPPEDYNAVPDRTELDGWHVGEKISLLEDNDEGGYEGDEGLIVGIAHMEAGLFGPAHDELLVIFDGYGEPVGVPPDIVEGV